MPWCRVYNGGPGACLNPLIGFLPHSPTPPLAVLFHPPVPMAPKVLMVSRHRPRPHRRRRLGLRGPAPPSTRADPNLNTFSLLVRAAAGRGEAQHRALHRLRPLRWPRKSSPSLLRHRMRADFFWGVKFGRDTDTSYSFGWCRRANPNGRRIDGC